MLIFCGLIEHVASLVEQLFINDLQINNECHVFQSPPHHCYTSFFFLLNDRKFWIFKGERSSIIAAPNSRRTNKREFSAIVIFHACVKQRKQQYVCTKILFIITAFSFLVKSFLFYFSNVRCNRRGRERTKKLQSNMLYATKIKFIVCSLSLSYPLLRTRR